MNAKAHVSVLVVVVLWAGSFSVIKKLLDDGVAAGDIAVLRYAIAAPGFAYILWRARGLPGLTRADAARVAVAGLLVVVGYHMFLNLGTRYTTSGVAALVVALAPGLTMLLAFGLGLDRISLRRVVGLAVAFTGVAIVVAFGAGNELSFESAKGPFIVLGAPLAFALYNVILKPFSGGTTCSRSPRRPAWSGPSVSRRSCAGRPSTPSPTRARATQGSCSTSACSRRSSATSSGTRGSRASVPRVR